MALVQPIPVSLLNIVPLDDATFLLWTRVHQRSDTVSITVNQTSCASQTAYIMAGDATYAFGFFSHDQLQHTDSGSVILHMGGAVVAHHQGPIHIQGTEHRLQQFFSSMQPQQQAALFSWMASLTEQQGTLASSPGFRRCCLQLLALMQPPAFHPAHGFWLSPYCLYFEGEGDIPPATGNGHLTHLSAERMHHAVCRWMQLTERTFGCIALFEDDTLMQHSAHGQFLYTAHGATLAVQPPQAVPAQGMEFIQFLTQKPPFYRQAVQEHLCNMLMEHAPNALRQHVASIIEKLQSYLEFPPTFCNNPQEPFNFYVEQVIPLGTEGIFTCGWMRDPYHMLQSITLHTALGYRFSIGEQMFRTKRPDVTQAFLNTPHGGFAEDAGFVAYTPLPAELRQKIESLGISLRTVRYAVTLRGGIQHHIQPQMHFRDAHASRDTVLSLVPGSDVSEAMMMECLGPTASILQRQCMQEVGIRQVYEFGTQVEAPRVSLSIPLYKRLDFLKIQFATLANDPAMRECEIIYVLDSPWQEAEVREFLKEYSHLYRLPVKLVVMKNNSGYAAASNTGTQVARGTFIVLLNSDVFPITKGWTHRMADFYESRKGTIGALAPKLLYEDDSLQHAGMFFAKTTLPDWLNLHYYKGYPRDYAAANITRPVPAVTGACLMIERGLWEEIGRLSTEYVVGDFEDSDLCLQCIRHGRENWYFAEAELYHLERQSVPLNESFSGSLAWRYNAHLHTARWGKLIASLMQTHKEC